MVVAGYPAALIVSRSASMRTSPACTFAPSETFLVNPFPSSFTVSTPTWMSSSGHAVCMTTRAGGELLIRINADMDEQFASRPGRHTYRVACLKDIDHFTVARRNDLTVRRLNCNGSSKHLRCKCLIADLRKRNDVSVDRASKDLLADLFLCLSRRSFLCAVLCR